MNWGTSTDVETLLGTLRQNEREAVFLPNIEGRTAAEISQLTAQPRDTVVSLLRRGFQKLRCSISPNLASDDSLPVSSS
jgi:DNA-directed RNA polymerase specialized sigma24 family protein